MSFEQSGISSICILRLSALGDVTHVLPLINALRLHYPGAKVTWICGKLEHKLLQHIPDVNFIVFDKSAGLSSYLDLYRQLSGRRFDVLLHMQVSARANIASLFIRAKKRIGWDWDSSRDLHQLFINSTIGGEKNRHQVQGFMAFTRALGIDVVTPVWNLPVLDEARAWVEQHVERDKKVLLISPCSSHLLRNWLVDRYAAVADYAADLGMQVVICGGRSDQEVSMGREIEQSMQAEAINLVGEDTLQQLIAMLARADVVLTPDSGPAHIANAVGAKVIGLYACTNPERSGPYNSLEHCVNRFPQAVTEFAHTTPDKIRWNKKIEQPGVMELISTEDVIEKLDNLLTE